MTDIDLDELHRTVLEACKQVTASNHFAHHMSKASIEPWFAFELAAALDGKLGRVALVERGGTQGANPLGNIDVLLVDPRQARHERRLGAPPPPWDGTAIAIELKAAHLRDSEKGYRNALVSDLLEKPGKALLADRPCAAWLGVLITTDGGWGPSVPGGDFLQRQKLKHDKALPLAPGLVVVHTSQRELAYREWKGSVWVDLVRKT
ncbi:MAG: hypothetical protein H6718_07710 [Polyangiaceae bacterium]|nr:hypothetical protein [Polyangiaceae bacterium]